MRTLFLGSYGYGNLGDELCLIEAMQSFPSSEVWVLSADPAFTAASVPGITGFIRNRADIKNLMPSRVVLGGGGVGFMPSIRDMLHWMYDAIQLGVECHVHNIGMAFLTDTSWVKVPEVQTILKSLASCSVRDHISWFCMRSWPAEITPKITLYPERLLPLDDGLIDNLPRRPRRRLLGISITGQKLMRQALHENPERIASKLALYRDYTIIPVISTVSDTDEEEDDIAGFRLFKQMYLNGFEVACEEFLDKPWWRANMTALKLKGIISELDVIFTQRKHNLIHAIGTQTPTVGIFPSIDDSIARIFFSLRDEIPPGSSQLSLIVKA